MRAADGRTDGQNYESKDLASIAASRGKNGSPMLPDCCLSCPVLSICDFGVMCMPNGWMDRNETWHACRPRPSPHCVRWGPSSTPKGHSPPHNFRRMSVMAKRSPISATAEHLYKRSRKSVFHLCGDVVLHAATQLSAM